MHVDVAVEGSAPVSIPGLPSTGAPIELDRHVRQAPTSTSWRPRPRGHSPSRRCSTSRRAHRRRWPGLPSRRRSPARSIERGGPVDAAGRPDRHRQSRSTAWRDFLMSPTRSSSPRVTDVACGTAQCYTVEASLTSDQVAAMLGGATAGLPVDLDRCDRRCRRHGVAQAAPTRPTWRASTSRAHDPTGPGAHRRSGLLGLGMPRSRSAPPRRTTVKGGVSART